LDLRTPSASSIAICRAEHKAVDGHTRNREAVRPSELRSSVRWQSAEVTEHATALIEQPIGSTEQLASSPQRRGVEIKAAMPTATSSVRGLFERQIRPAAAELIFRHPKKWWEKTDARARANSFLK
jgi:hypothetical protein